MEPESMMAPRLTRLLERANVSDGPLMVLTGAGISAESGVPTFRGTEGYWRVGSRNFSPMELATREAFAAMPDEVWGWYLYRRAVCRAARPNAAHRALAGLERARRERFLLVTQNVDGLHLRAGHTPDRVYQIHGNIDYMRCAGECEDDPIPLPQALGETWEKGRLPGSAERALLRCSGCGGRSRPHVLWFDESYDERLFRYQSSLSAAERSALLIVIGTSGATTLPARICGLVARRGAPMVVVGPEATSFSELAERSGGLFLRGTACAVVPQLARELQLAG
jgi:NAD-dependent deacetylase